MLVIPDLYDKAYVRELVNLLLVGMGFKQICAQQVFSLFRDDSFPTLLGISSSHLWRRHLQCLRC